MPHQVGYCCINVTLNKQKVTTGRTMRQARFKEDKSLSHTSFLALQNSQDLIKILRWNVDNGVKVFRISSNIFPWNSEYHVEDLPDYLDIAGELYKAGKIILDSQMRVSFHPDHYVKLASSKPDVVRKAIHDLEHHNLMFEMMGIPVSHYYPLNIHVGQNFSQDIIDRFCDSFMMLNEDTRKRLVVENDDKANAFSIKQLYDNIYKKINTPLTFDYFHHIFHQDGLTSQEAATLAHSTWDTTPLFHYSESKNINENVQGNPRAHSDYVFSRIDDFGLTFDVDLEAKAKELAWQKYKEI